MEDQSAKLLAGYRERLTFARAELDLIGQSDAARRTALATLQAEQALRQANLPLTGSAADRYREEARHCRGQCRDRRQGEAWEKLRDTGSSAIDSLVDGALKGDLMGGLKAAASDYHQDADGFCHQPAEKRPARHGPADRRGSRLDLRAACRQGRPAVRSCLVGGRHERDGRHGLDQWRPRRRRRQRYHQAALACQQQQGRRAVRHIAVRRTGSPLSFVGNYRKGVDPRLTDILNSAAQQFPGFKVDAISGLRPGDPRFHGKGLATDIQLTDLISGKRLGNYQDAASFGTYERFAQTARQIQMQRYPELADKFRWGGYFGGAKGKYGALDTMHFDLAGAGMAGGSWERGLTSAQASLWPGIKSQAWQRPRRWRG